VSGLPPGFAPRLLIFDLDGTLVDSAAGIAASFNHALTTVARVAPLPQARITRMIGLPLAQMFAETLPPALEGRIPDCIAAYRAHYDETAVPNSRLFPGVRTTLETLHTAGRTLTVATTKYSFVAEAVIASVGLRPLFAHVLGGDSVPEHKPHPALVLKTLALTGAPPDDALVVGDSTYDMLMAAAANVRAVGVTYGVHAREELRSAGATTLIDAPPDLLPLVGAEGG
jgi:phosphoglycolate phosphatase